MTRAHFMFIVLLFPALQVIGQPILEKNFDRYTISSGLSNDVVSGIVQDARGYVWISTAAGLNRFNGSRFVQFHSNDDSLSLPAESILNLSWLDNARLAVLTSGLHIIDTKTGKTHNIFIPYHDLRYQFKFNMVERVLGDENGHAYVLSRSGFYHYDKDYKLLSRFDYYTEAETATEHFYWGREVFHVDEKRLLITAVNGIFLYDKEKRTVKKMVAADIPGMAELLSYPKVHYSFYQPKKGSFFVYRQGSDSITYFNTIENRKKVSSLNFKPLRNDFHWRSRLSIANDSVFYISSHYSGFYKFRFDPASGDIKFFPWKYFDAYVCNSILTDKENNLWISTTKGLFRQNLQKSQVETVGLPAGMQLKFPDAKFDDIYVSEDKVYAGLRGGAGVIVFNKQTFEPEKHLLYKKNTGANNVHALASLDSNTLLLGTNGPLLLLNRKTWGLSEMLPPKWYYPGDWTSDIYKDRRGDMWISANYIYRYRPSDGSYKVISNHPQLLSVPFAIEEDTTGNIWMACHGLARYNTTLDSFDLLLDSFPFIKMPDKQINALVIDGQNRLWFNSNNNGLLVYDIGKRDFQHFTRSNGLPDNNIASLIVIGNKLWIACYSGIACMDLRTLKIVSFNKEDGFPEMPVSKGARFFYDKEFKQLYIGFFGVLGRFNPYEVMRRKLSAQVFVESVLINGHTNIFLPGKEIKTSWKDNEISVTIGTINFSDGISQRLAYRIFKDTNSEWVQIGNQPSFNISNLSPGNHRLQAKLFSPNNRWPEQVYEMNVVVFPPLWKEDWFVISLVALVLLLFYFLIKWRIGMVRKKEMEKTHLQKLKTDDYKNQFELEQISNYFSSSLADKKTEEDVLWDVTENLIGRMNYEDCMIYLWNDDKTKMIQKAAYGPKGKPEFISSQVFEVLPGQGIVGHVMNQSPTYTDK